MAEPVPAFVDQAFTAWDSNKDGALSRVEFENGWKSVRQLQRRNADAGLRTQFSSMDRNKNGGIDPDEYSSLLLIKRAGTQAPPLSQFDANRNGRLEFAEYQVLVRQESAAASAKPGPAPAASGK